MISIVIPAYNARHTIVQCLESIFAQTYQDFEIIVVDDGSTDNTAKAVLDCARKIYSSSEAQWNREVLRLLTQENMGANAARNRGWKECKMKNVKCKMVLFCDADIVLRRDCLEKMVRALEAHPEASYAYSSFKFNDFLPPCRTVPFLQPLPKYSGGSGF